MTATIAPNPADFSQNPREREYEALIDVRGTISISLMADSQEDAQRQAKAELKRIEKDGFVELYCIDEIEVNHVRKERPMFRVTREGKKMQVSHLDPGDLPREPDERGF